MKHVFPQLPLLISSYLYPIHLHIHSLECSSFCFRSIYLLELVIYTHLSECPWDLVGFLNIFLHIIYLYSFSPLLPLNIYITSHFFGDCLFQALYKVYFTYASPNSLLPLTSHSKAWTSLMLLILYYTVEKVYVLLTRMTNRILIFLNQAQPQSS